MMFEQPLGPMIGEVGVDTYRVDQIEVTVGLGQRRLLGAAEEVERRRQVPPQPINAGSVDVTSGELGSLCLRSEVTNHLPYATAEIQHTLTVPAPVMGEHRLDESSSRCANLVIRVGGCLLAQEPGALQQVQGWGGELRGAHR